MLQDVMSNYSLPFSGTCLFLPFERKKFCKAFPVVGSYDGRTKEYLFRPADVSLSRSDNAQKSLFVNEIFIPIEIELIIDRPLNFTEHHSSS